MINEIIGGSLIGLATAILWLGIGRISGITAVISGLFQWQQIQKQWAYWFFAGLLVAYPLYHALGFTAPIEVTSNKSLLVVAGLLVGFGTYIGNGCTSGHGVCGTGRLSVRSIVATITFMLAGVATVAAMNLLQGFTQSYIGGGL